MDPIQALKILVEGQSLSLTQMTGLMQQIMSGAVAEPVLAALLIALRMKGESIDELQAAVSVMRELATRVPVQSGAECIDTCGTGGDGGCTFNISTTAAFVVAAAGGRVAKHGNRSMSSLSGSADVLEAAGVNLELTPEQVGRCIDQVGIGFMFAQRHHGAMKYTSPVRKQLGVRTLFNLLGPMVNPAGAAYQLMGVFDAKWLEPVAQVLGNLGARHVLVVHGDRHLDELSLSGPSRLVEWRDGRLNGFELDPRSLGLSLAPLEALQVTSVAESLDWMHRVLANEPGPARDIVLLNAGAALYAADRALSIEQGMAMAEDALSLGAARDKLDELVQFSQGLQLAV